MTKEEIIQWSLVKNKIVRYKAVFEKVAEDAMNQYAISVLEDIATTATIEGAYIKMNEKIQQLRKLITV